MSPGQMRHLEPSSSSTMWLLSCFLMSIHDNVFRVHEFPENFISDTSSIRVEPLPLFDWHQRPIVDFVRSRPNKALQTNANRHFFVADACFELAR